MPRQARLDAPGTLHHAIVRGIEKRCIVDDDQDRENFVTRMGVLSLETKTAIYAWALMSNHAHILLRSGPECDQRLRIRPESAVKKSTIGYERRTKPLRFFSEKRRFSYEGSC